MTKDFIDNVKLEYKYPLKGDIDYVSKVINSWALSSVREGNINEAKRLLSSFLEIHDAPPLLYYNLGQIYNMFNEYESALQYAHKAIEIKKDFKEAYDLIGNIYFKIEDYEHSLLAYKEVINIDHTDAMGHYNIGCVHHGLEHFDKAEKCWKDALRYERGVKRRKEREKISEDELNISMIVEEAPVSLKAHKSLGKFYFDRKQIIKALKHYKSAYELSSNDPELCYKLGKIYYDQDDWANAIH